MEVDAPHLAFACEMEAEPQFFLGCLDQDCDYSLEVFSFLGCPFLVLWLQREQAFFVCLFVFGSVPIGISELMASSAPSLGYMRQNKQRKNKQTKRKPQGTHHHVIPWVMRPLDNLFLLSTSQSLLTFVLHIISRVFSCI